MNIFYIIWLALPVFYLLVALWSFLEAKGKGSKKQNPQDFVRPAFFLLVGAIVSIGVDQYVLTGMEASLPDFLSPNMVRVLILPIVLLLLGTVIGGSKPPSLKKNELNKK